MPYKKMLFLLFALACLEYAGVGAVLTNFTALFFHTSWLSASVRLRDFSLIMMVVPLAQFLMAPFLGKLSDHIGRRPLIIFGSFSAVLGFFLTTVALSLKSLELLWVARLFTGLSLANIGVIQAAMADMTSAKKRTGGFNLLLIATGLGLSLGPALGGVLADPKWVSWFNYATPFLFLTVCSALVFFLVYCWFEESRAPLTEAEASWRDVLVVPTVRRLLFVWVLFMGGWTLYEVFFNKLMADHFFFSLGSLGLLSTYIGVLSLCFQIFLVPFLGARYEPWFLLKVTGLGLGVSIMLLPLLPVTPLLWVLALYAGFMAIFLPNVLALISTATRQCVVGRVLGLVASLRALVSLLIIPVGGVFAAISSAFPIYCGGLLIVISWGIITFTQCSKQESARDLTQDGIG